jgi:trimeric autotransporter adhesin
MALYTEAVQKLYVAYFSRPADAAGLAYWENVVTAAKGNTTAVSAAFAASQEYKDTFAGQSAYQVINTIYQNLFGRPAEAAALTFWGQGLLNGNFTIDNAVTAIAAGAQTTDLVAYNSKVAAATAFTAALDTSAEMIGYNGAAANAAAKTWLAGITTEEALKAAIEPAALNGTVGTVTNPPVVGQTYVVGAGVENLVGTSANDTFNARNVGADGQAAITLNAFDSIDGGAGTDTLNIYTETGVNTSLPASASVKNVEIINLYNKAGAEFDSGNATGVTASQFVGANQVWQIGSAVGVNSLAATTTAGFRSVTLSTPITVAAASGAASANIALEAVKGAALDNSVGINTTGTSTVNVSGTIAKADADVATAANLALGVTAAKDAKTVTVNSAVATTLTVNEAASSAAANKVTTVNAAGSAGAITFVADADTTAITTGAGADKVTVQTQTSKATTTAAAVNASVSTGAGNDTITVLTTGDGTTTVDAGAGNDTIKITKVTGNVLNIMGGEGNDIIEIVSGVLATTDVIDGGAGTDTISVAGAASRNADDYIVFNKLLKNFETIKFTGATAEGALDASQLAANYTTIDLNTGAVVTKVGTQTLVANGNLTATTAGTDVAEEEFAGTLNITSKATGTVSANADVVKLAVTAGTSAVTTTLAGDAQSAIVTLTKGANSAGTADVAAAVVVNTTAADANLASLTLSGNGTATVTNAAGSSLTSVDASALASKVVLGATAGAATAGLVYSSANAAVETIKLGAGLDTITLSASTYGKMDTVTGLNLVLNTAGTAIDTTKSDVLNVTGINGGAVKFTTTQTDFDLALKDAAAYTVGGAARDTLVFQFGGDTYVYKDLGVANSVDAADIVVKLTGTIDLDALILSLGGTPV